MKVYYVKAYEPIGQGSSKPFGLSIKEHKRFFGNKPEAEAFRKDMKDTGATVYFSEVPIPVWRNRETPEEMAMFLERLVNNESSN